MFVGIGGKVYTKTVNPALGEYRNKSDKFRPTSQNGKVRKLKDDTDKKARNRLTRASYCHEYIGEGISGYEELLKSTSDVDLQYQYEKNLFQKNCQKHETCLV